MQLTPPWTGRWHGFPSAGVLVLTLTVAACGKSSTTAPPPASTVATTTTTAPVSSNLSVQGVKPAVLQAPFYPMVTVSAVTCGPGPGGRFVRLDLPPGPAGTPVQSGLSQSSYVIVLPGKAELRDKTGHVFYSDTSRGIVTSTQGAFVLALLAPSGNVVQVNGDYTCPTPDVAYPGT